jgi:hypothetical protein
MRLEEVERFEGVGRGVIGLLWLWKCVEKCGKKVCREQWVVSRGLKPGLGASAVETSKPARFKNRPTSG